jgi:dihydrofolate reductase
MKIYHVAAISENHVIGKDGSIPWNHRDDLKRFREITLGHPVIMGRKTYESLGKLAPLSGRYNIVITSTADRNSSSKFPLVVDGQTKISRVSSLEEALALCARYHEVFIVGGERVYRESLDLADELRITLIHQDVEGGDAFYPEIDPAIWRMSFVEPHEDYTFIDYVRHRS